MSGRGHPNPSHSGIGGSGGGGRSILPQSSPRPGNEDWQDGMVNGIMSGEKNRALPVAFASLTPIMKEAFLTNEYVAVTQVLQKEKQTGVYIIPSAQSSDLWFGVIFVHPGSSPYQGGIFRFTVRFPSDFPASTTIPIVTFQPPIFHPSIHPTRGLFDLKRYFKQGWSQQAHVWQILKIVRTGFYKVESVSCVNKQAHDLVENDLLLFNSRAQKEADSSIKRLYDECPSEYNRDKHWITFSPYDNALHEQFRRPQPNKVNLSRDGIGRTGVQRGLSWM